MHTSKVKKQEPKTNEEVKNIKVASFDVANVRVIGGKNGDVVFFTLTFNEETIYNCRVSTGRNGDFISWPQVKGTNDKYYNQVYARLSNEDQEAILNAVQEAIDNM